MCTLQFSPHCVESSWTPTIKRGICSQVQYALLAIYFSLSKGKKRRKSWQLHVSQQLVTEAGIKIKEGLNPCIVDLLISLSKGELGSFQYVMTGIGILVKMTSNSCSTVWILQQLVLLETILNAVSVIPLIREYVERRQDFYWPV